MIIRAHIISAGLTNNESESYGIIASANPVLNVKIAYCDSDKCCSDHTGDRVFSKISKKVKRNQIYCSDCDRALFWKNIRKAIK